MSDVVEDLAIRLSGQTAPFVKAMEAAVAAGDAAAGAAVKAQRASEATTTAAVKASNAQVSAAKKASAAQQELGQKMLMAGGLLLAGFALAVHASMGFTKQMSEVGAVSGATAVQMKQLSAAALKAGADTVFSANDAAKAEAELAKGGLSVADIIGGGLTGAMNLASAGQLDVARSAEITATALSQFNLQGSAASHVADLLAAGANKALGSVDDLAQGLKFVGPVAHGMGVSIEQTVGVLAEFAQAGLKGEQGGTSLRGVLSSLTSPSAQAAATMKELNLVVFDGAGKFVGLDGMAQQLHQSLGGLTEAERSNALGRIFGNQQITAARVLYEGGAKAVQDWTKAVDQNGYAAELAAKKMDNLSGDVENLRGSIDTALIKSGGGANEVLRFMAQRATGAVNAFSALPGPLQAGLTAVVALTGGLAVMMGAFLVARAQAAKFQIGLVELGVSEERVAFLSRGVGIALKTIGVAAVGLGLLEIAEQLNTIGAKAPQVEKGTLALVNLAQQGHLTGDALKIFGNDFQHIGQQIDIAGRGYWTSFTTGQRTIKDARTALDDLDKGLAGLVNAGHGDLAAADFTKISTAAKAQGVSVGALKKVFDDYDNALAAQATQQKLAAGATAAATTSEQAHAAALKASSQAAKDNATAVRNLSDALKAQFDPIFAVADALTRQKAAQKAATDALKAHGAASSAYKQASLDALKATVDITGAVGQLKAALIGHTTSQKAVNAQLDAYAKAGLISTGQAAAFKTQLSGVITQTDKLAPKLGVLNSVKVQPKVDAHRITDADTAAGRLGRKLQALDAMVATPTVIVSFVTRGLTSTGAIRGVAQDSDFAGKGLHRSGGATGGPGSASLADLKAAAARAQETPVDKARLEDLNAGAAVTKARAAAAATAAAARSSSAAYQAAARHAADLRNRVNELATAYRHATKYTRDSAADAVAAARIAQTAADKTAAAAKAAMGVTATAAKNAGTTLAEALAAATTAHAALADAVYADQVASAKAFTDDISSQLDTLVAKADTMRGSFASAVTAGSALGDLFKDAESGAAVGVNSVIYKLQQQITQSNNLADLVTQLQGQGLSDSLINQVTAAGLGQGTQIAQAILAGGPEAIAQLNDLTAQLNTVATTGLDQVVTSFYGQGATALQQLAAGMAAGLPELDAVLGQIAAKVNSVLGTSSRTNVPAPAGTAKGGTNVSVSITVAPQGLVVGTSQQVAAHLAPDIRDQLSKLTRLGS